MEITDVIITAAHLIAGFILVFYAAKAYKKTKFPPMLYLLIGFAVLVLGGTIIEDFFGFLNNDPLEETIAESFEILGFIILILAVKKS